MAKITEVCGWPPEEMLAQSQRARKFFAFGPAPGEIHLRRGVVCSLRFPHSPSPPLCQPHFVACEGIPLGCAVPRVRSVHACFVVGGVRERACLVQHAIKQHVALSQGQASKGGGEGGGGAGPNTAPSSRQFQAGFILCKTTFSCAAAL